jgi:inorganic pyrophosphatase
MARRQSQASPEALDPFDGESGDLNVIVETPKGSRNKFKFDEEHGLYKLAGVLPAGMGFPFDFGFIPSTEGEDGDPVDVLLLMDEPAFPGCLVPARLIGVIEAEQTEDGETVRNDRLLAVAVDSALHKDVVSITQLSANLLDEIEAFFDAYTRLRGKHFQPLSRSGPETAKALVEEAMTEKPRSR